MENIAKIMHMIDIIIEKTCVCFIPKLSKDLDGCYTRLLRTAVNDKQHMTNQQLFGNLSKITIKIREKRLRFAGHCCRNTDEDVSRLLLWNPKHGKKASGRPSHTYLDMTQGWRHQI